MNKYINKGSIDGITSAILKDDILATKWQNHKNWNFEWNIATAIVKNILENGLAAIDVKRSLGEVISKPTVNIIQQ